MEDVAQRVGKVLDNEAECKSNGEETDKHKLEEKVPLVAERVQRQGGGHLTREGRARGHGDTL
jgi:hypothetical protein